MRVIAGKFRSRAVKGPKGEGIRPTSDKVKGALFNMLGPLEGLRVLDLYSGTGSLGIEALSRGASEAVFVDKGPESLKLIRENLAHFGIDPGSAGSGARVMAQDAGQALYLLHQEGAKFDILMADPPYEKGVLQRVQRLLMEYPVLSAGGTLAVEHGPGDLEMSEGFPLGLVRQKKYGDTFLSLFRGGTLA